MIWRLLSVVFLLAGFLTLPFWPYAKSVPAYLPAFCFFVGVLLFLVSVFARRGSEVWKNRGQG